MQKPLVPVLLALGLSACATRPEHIAPTLVSAEPCMARDCGQLADSLQTAQADLKKFSDMQTRK